jgi:N-acetylneuraminate synthase
MSSVKIIAEIGINHNGDIDIAKKLIDIAVVAGCDYAKFQKRTPDICVPEPQKNKMRSTPWGEVKYIDYKKKIEFEKQEYDELYDYIKDKPIEIFASAWDQPSIDFMSEYTDITKIGSALITDLGLCKYARDNSETLIISTGMSTEEEIEACISACNPDVVMHTNSSYPSKIEELNLSYIRYLKEKYSNKEVGYSGHEFGLVTTFAAVAMGASWVERHITLDRSMWGSDQVASVEPIGLIKLVKGIRDIEKSIGPGGPRKVLGSEMDKRKSLRGK